MKEVDLNTNRHNNDNAAGGHLGLGLGNTQLKSFTIFVVVVIVGGIIIFSFVKFIKSTLFSTKSSNLDDTSREKSSGNTNNLDNADKLLFPPVSQVVIASNNTTSPLIRTTTSNNAISNSAILNRVAAAAPEGTNNYTKVVEMSASGKSKSTSPSRSISGGRRRKTAASVTK